MVGVGCFMSASLFVGLVSLGFLVADQQGGSRLLGMAAGFVTWVALMSAHMCLLTIQDWRDRHKYPHRIGLTWRGVAATWLVFAGAVAGSALLWCATAT